MRKVRNGGMQGLEKNGLGNTEEREVDVLKIMR